MNTHTHTYPPTHTHPHTHTHPQTHTHTITHAHTQPHKYSHANIITYTNTHDKGQSQGPVQMKENPCAARLWMPMDREVVTPSEQAAHLGDRVKLMRVTLVEISGE